MIRPVERAFNIPYASTNTDIVMETSISLVMFSSSAIWNEAGATMDEDTGEMKVKNDMAMAAAHF